MTIQNGTLQVMVLLNAEVWGDTAENQTDWQRCAAIMCDIHRLPRTEANMTALMTEGWVNCKVGEDDFKLWCNSVVNVLGDKGQVLIPALVAEAKEAITRADTRFEIGFNSSEWFAYWGVITPEPDVV